MPTPRSTTARSPKLIAKAVGLTKADAKEWRVQYVLLKRLQKIVNDEGLTHAEVARKGTTSRPRVTAILNGNLDNVSTDLLIRLLESLGYDVRVSVSRSRAA